jgi:hypothetical protein
MVDLKQYTYENKQFEMKEISAPTIDYQEEIKKCKTM